MARTWLSVTVELLGGGGTDLWPWPGRIFAVGPAHTFSDLAEAINDAFARWDRSHLSMFNLADGRMIADVDTGADLTNSIAGPITDSLDIETTKVARTLALGEEFQFTFDLGDNWVHRCEVGPAKIDPLDTLGIVPRKPLPYWGWGSIPDQYGRRWSDDDGESRVPRRPAYPHPMQTHAWPAKARETPVDMTELRQAIADADAEGFLAAVRGHEIEDVLQQVGAGLPMLLSKQGERAEPVVLAVVNRLSFRGGDGDGVLADDLIALLRGEPLAGRVAPVDLETLAYLREGDPLESSGGYLDLVSGEAFNESAADEGMVGEDAAIDVDEDPERWLWFPRAGGRDGWEDMAAFAARQRDAQLRERLERAIEGRGAFRRFRDVVDQEGMAEQWFAYAEDRKQGRARQFLADEGIRVGRPSEA
ncbi:UPF0158 family protein [Mycolicibacterium brumae]|uniref:Uncharacterized protein n=1 Tax=Mycolicibacterium brumae TaxID=85968 RepID=A0A2G5PH27_9MYCO|nr:UPF0158 family protein [Mycolicibacterium brumae]MCV7194324.1 hypothetical protein [Mycolicibacterium brumae]PIB77274.1 hypothetical protein CQY22_003280 [Mycolicibacterium brumae]RWA15528.1 hypothetical protein MBRU_10785 [Mycolicibacterium brumae DSM 44177]UWW10639.1 plasmid pRiA4b ORF-3 family protein [Mycolicibacterium brumae]